MYINVSSVCVCYFKLFLFNIIHITIMHTGKKSSNLHNIRYWLQICMMSWAAVKSNILCTCTYIIHCTRCTVYLVYVGPGAEGDGNLFFLSRGLRYCCARATEQFIICPYTARTIICT